MNLSKKKIHYSAFEKRDFAFVYICIALPVIQFAIFWLYVNFSSFTLAFQTPQGNFTLQNFKEVFLAFRGNDVNYGFNLGVLLGRSLTLFSIAQLLVTPFSILCTYVLYRKTIGHYVFRVIFMLPGLIGSVTWVSTLKQILDYNGIVVTALQNMGVDFDFMVLKQGLLASESTAFKTLIGIMVFNGLGGGSAVLTGAFARIPKEIYEVGELDGIGFWKEFFRIALPCAWPVISMQMVFSLSGIFMAEGDAFLYSQGTGEPGIATMGFYLTYIVYRLSQSTALELPFGYPAALGLVLTVMTVPICLLGRWFFEKISEPVEF